MAERHSCHSMGWKVGSQPLLVDFQAGCLVEDAGLLAVRELDVSLGVLSDLAGRLPDPRSPKYIQHPRCWPMASSSSANASNSR